MMGTCRRSGLTQLVCACCVVAALSITCAPPCAAQAELTPEEQLQLIDETTAHLQWLLGLYDTGEYYIIGQSGLATIALVPVPKEHIITTVSTLVYIGQIEPADVPKLIDALKRFSDQVAVAMRQRVADLGEQRRQLAGGAGTAPATPTTDGQRPQGAHWQLKPGFPKITNLNTSNSQTEAVDSNVSGTTMMYHYTKRGYAGNLEHEFTLTAGYGGLGKQAYAPGEEFVIELEGSFTRGKDCAWSDGKCPFFYSDTGVRVVKTEPLVGDRRPADCAQLWLGRFTDGKDRPTDHRSITAVMPEHGDKCEYGIAIDPNHRVAWEYEWVK
ncbi:MAG TPA: hypothetical protein DGT21_02260 [Armatimonadetes bacterium]|jgi:hypothetical protein|nr:hypothetical protein [Armatimonadota bacterium]